MLLFLSYSNLFLKTSYNCKVRILTVLSICIDITKDAISVKTIGSISLWDIFLTMSFS